MRLFDEEGDVGEVAVGGEHGPEVADVVPAVSEGRLVEGEEPEAVDAEPLEVLELLHETGEVARTVAVGVEEPADEHFVERGAAIPPRVVSRVERHRHYASPGLGTSLARRRCTMWAGWSGSSRMYASGPHQAKTWSVSSSNASSGSSQGNPSAPRSIRIEPWPPCNGSRLTTTRTVSTSPPAPSTCLEYATRGSEVVGWKRRLARSPNAGCRRRISLRRARRSPIEPDAVKSRGLISYFSEWAYSSLVSDAGSFSHSS